MDKKTLEEYREHLETFLNEYKSFIKGYYHTSDNKDRITVLQQLIPFISKIVSIVHGGGRISIQSMDLNFRQALGYSLTKNIPRDDVDFVQSNIILTLNEAIGNIINNTIPSHKIEPILPIVDEELRKRCVDLLNSKEYFDRVIREATVVLEHRLRGKLSHEKLSEIIPNSAEQIGESLANNLLAPSNPVIVVSDDKLERTAFLKMMQGIFAYLRNSSHHSLDNATKWSFAWSVVGLIDSVLLEIENSYIAEGYLEEPPKSRKKGKPE